MNIEIATAPDVRDVDVPKDAWTQPFWDAAERGELLLPHCVNCGHFRWPPGPFCPHCRSQAVAWTTPGAGQIYSFTVLREGTHEGVAQIVVPALIEFPAAGGIRFMAAIADTPIDRIRIGAAVALSWSPAMNAAIPIFRVT